MTLFNILIANLGFAFYRQCVLFYLKLIKSFPAASNFEPVQLILNIIINNVCSYLFKGRQKQPQNQVLKKVFSQS